MIGPKPLDFGETFPHFPDFLSRPSHIKSPGRCSTLTTSAISTGIVGCIHPRNMGSECPGIVVVLTCLGCPWEAIRSEDSVGICNPPKKKKSRKSGLLHHEPWEFKKHCSKNSKMFKFWIVSIIGPPKDWNVVVDNVKTNSPCAK